MPRFASILALFCLSAGLRADVTIRYQTEYKPAPALQPVVEQFMKAAMANTNREMSIRMRGDKGYTTAGKLVEILDFTKGDVTLIDPAQKTYATLPLAQLGDKMAGAIPQATPEQNEAVAKALASIRTDVSSKLTGNTAEIQGVQAEEHELTLTMNMPMPGMTQNGPTLKLVMHIWTAKKEEALRSPAIRELTAYYAWQKYVLNPASVFEKLGAKLPGLSNTLTPMMEEIYKTQSVILRSQTQMYMPFLVTMAKQLQASGKPEAAQLSQLDPDAPLVEIYQEAAELSTAPVDASLFEIPKDYQSSSADEMVKQVLQSQAESTIMGKQPPAEASPAPK